jgi:hypothetical protein
MNRGSVTAAPASDATRDHADRQSKEDDMSQLGSPPRIVVLGRSLRALERIATIGALLGLNRSSSYRLARREVWPMVGPAASGWVLTLQVLDRYGIAYRLESEETLSLPVGSQAASCSADCAVGQCDGSFGCCTHHTDACGVAPSELERDDQAGQSL